MAIVYLIIAVIAFYFGFSIGKNKKYNIKKSKVKVPEKAEINLISEYENFLNYDGSEQ